MIVKLFRRPGTRELQFEPQRLRAARFDSGQAERPANLSRRQTYRLLGSDSWPKVEIEVGERDETRTHDLLTKSLGDKEGIDRWRHGGDLRSRSAVQKILVYEKSKAG